MSYYYKNTITAIKNGQTKEEIYYTHLRIERAEAKKILQKKGWTILSVLNEKLWEITR